MRLDVSAVDGRAFRHRAADGQSLDKIDPEAFARPAVEAIVDCGRRTILFWTVAPTAPNLEDVNDARDHPAIINPTSATLVPRQ